MYKRIVSSTITVIAIGLFAAGCATVPDEPLGSLDDSDIVNEATSSWTKVPPLVYREVSKTPVLDRPNTLPWDIASKSIDISLARNATVSDLVHALSLSDVPAMVLDPEIAKRAVHVPRFKGPIGPLLSVVADALGISFVYSNGVVLARPAGEYVVTLPQDKELIESVTAELTRLGATNVASSVSAGIVSFGAPRDRNRVILSYIERVINNTSMINLQVAIVAVSLTREKERGIDWSALEVTLGDGLVVGENGVYGNGIKDQSSRLPMWPNPGMPGQPNPGQGSDDPVSAAARLAGTLSGNGIGLLVNEDNFSLQGMISLLSKYGETRTTQNLILKTISGRKVRLRSGDTVPYVSDVNVGGFGGASYGTGSLLGGANTDTIETGLTLEVTPSFDEATGIVTMGVDLELSQVVEMVQLSAGNQLGSFTQPHTKVQEFNDVARILVGDTVILGGLVFEQDDDIRNTLNGLEKLPVGHKAANQKRQALFVVIRPTATVYRYAAQ